MTPERKQEIRDQCDTAQASTGGTYWTASGMTPEMAKFLPKAPGYVTELLDEVERLEKAVVVKGEVMAGHRLAVLAKAVAACEKLRERLSLYAGIHEDGIRIGIDRCIAEIRKLEKEPPP